MIAAFTNRVSGEPGAAHVQMQGEAMVAQHVAPQNWIGMEVMNHLH